LGQGGAGDLALLKCNSNYPSDPAEMNLRTIADMARRFKLPIGLSDHTRNTATAVTAVALGACIVERHFTIPGGESSPDAAFSLLPDEFRRMVDDIRIAEQSLGKVFYGRTAGEERSLRFRRSLFIVQDVRRGETLTPENLRVIRPGDGLPPVHYRELLGRTVTRDLSRGTPLAWDMVQGRRGSRQA
jgi:sialic acid synthase SpsE